jgi:hypothetical protein
VGNDPVKDMVVGTIGMKTFLVTDADSSVLEVSRSGYRLAPADIPKPDFEGPLLDVPAVVQALMYG